MSYYQEVVMKNIKRHIFLYFLLIAFIPGVFAEITINLPEKEVYNLGESIVPTVLIKEEQNYTGFFKLTLACDKYNLLYYTTPLNTEAGQRSQITIPELTFFSEMKGTCSIEASFDQNNGESMDKVSSKNFVVTDELNIASNENLESNPGDNLLILADVKKASGEVLSKGDSIIKYRDGQINTVVSIGKLEYRLHVSPNTEAADYPILIQISDKFGNKGEKTLSLKIPQIPTTIENDIQSNILMPGDSFIAKITLYDHTHRVINASKIDVKIFGSNEKLLVEKEVESLDTIEMTTTKSQNPGDYFLLSAFENVKAQSTFTVKEVKKIAMKQEGAIVNVENVGNVDYKDDATIVLENEGKKYLINKKIELKPQEILKIDLSEEVPQGTYDVTLPENAIEQKPQANKSNETKADLVISNLIKGVKIDDRRPASKKAVDGISYITGKVISAAKVIASRPALASILIVTIVLGVVVYYGRGAIMGKIRRRKDDAIFKDYDFHEENKK